MGFEPTHAEHNGLAVHRLNHSATSSHRGCAIEPDGNRATHPEREGMEGKELDTGDVVPKMASYARFRHTKPALKEPFTPRMGFEPTRAEQNGLAVHRQMEIQPLIEKGKVRSWTLVMKSLKWPPLLCSFE